MINVKHSLILVSVIFVLTSAISTKAQEKPRTLLTIADESISAKEFKRVYSKNLDLVKDEAQKDVDQYLQLFIDYKLKIKAAIASGLDQKQSYKDELSKYRKQLANSYLTDTEVSDALVKEAYDHMQEAVNASHILIKMAPDAIPADTLKIYNRIIEARNRVIGGEDFNVVAKEISEDPSAAKNGGDLGWFSAFRMVYPFEKNAFDTEVGSVSMPFTTRFGYHILRVNDRRPTTGEISAAHIMISVTSGDKEDQAKERIDDIYKQLKEGAAFETLARQYSDDRHSASQGGQLKKFALGNLNAPKFEAAAFSLTDPGSYTEPVRSGFGWHVIKLIEKHEKETFEALKTELSEKIKKDSRSQLITDAFIETIKKKYKPVIDKDAVYAFFEKRIKSGDTLNGTLISQGQAYEDPILRIKETNYAYKDFVAFLNQSKRGVVKDVRNYVQKNFDVYLSKTLLDYYDKNLEEDNEDFAAVMTEYRDGLLLFDLMETKIWNAAKTDTLGLQKYFETHRSHYQWPDRFKVQKASTQKKEVAISLESDFKEGKSLQEIKSYAVETDGANAIFSEVLWTHEEAMFPDGFVPEKGSVVLLEDQGYYTVVKVIDILESQPKALEETKGKVISDFQKELEKDWLAKLREKYPVTLHKKVLKKVKKELRR